MSISIAAWCLWRSATGQGCQECGLTCQGRQWHYSRPAREFYIENNDLVIDFYSFVSLFYTCRRFHCGRSYSFFTIITNIQAADCY